MSIEEYLKVLEYYKINKPTNIYKIKKIANKCMMSKMCKTNKHNSNYKKVLFVMLNRKIASHNKKNVASKTMKYHCRFTHNKTPNRSPISYLCT